MKKILLLLGVTALVAGCSTSHRMGDFTAASSQNVRNLEYSVSENSMSRVKGESCRNQIFIFGYGPVDARVQRAMDAAIENGRESGIDGDMLVNVRIEVNNTAYPFYHSNCVVVTGDLVTVNK